MVPVMRRARHALRQPNPFEGGTDIRQQVVTGAAVVLGDAPAETVHLPFQRPVRVAHQGHDGPVTGLHVTDAVFAEEAVHPEAVDVDQRQGGLVGDGLAA